MFILIFEQLVKMFFIMLLAILCYKIKLVNQEGNKTVSNLLLLVVNPFVIITTYQTDYKPELVRGLLISFGAAVLCHIVGILVTTLLIRPKGSPDANIERYNAMYSNCGFIGIPLINSVLGSNGVFFLSAYIVVFNLFSWTHGVVLMEKKFSWKNVRKGLMSPMVIATIIAVLLFFSRIRFPEVALDSMNYVADMNTPLAMMVAGFSVAQTDILKMCTKLRVYFSCFLKLVLIPVIMIFILKIIPLPQDVAMTKLIASACPAATTGTMMAIRYKQNYTYSSEMFALSTILAVATIPLIVLLAETVL